MPMPVAHRPVRAASPHGAGAVPAWLLLFVHVLAFLHLGLSPHRIDSCTGAVLHVDPAAPGEAPTVPVPGESHDDCLVFSAMTQAAGMPVALAATGALPAIFVFNLYFPAALSPVDRRELHRLSPSNSPPSVA